MALELMALDGEPYTRCIRKDLFDSADDMFESGCKRVKLKIKKDRFEDICFFAAENGNVDTGKYAN